MGVQTVRLVIHLMSILVLSVMLDFICIMGYVIINALLRPLLQHLELLKYVLIAIQLVQLVKQPLPIVLLVQQQEPSPFNSRILV